MTVSLSVDWQRVKILALFAALWVILCIGAILSVVIPSMDGAGGVSI